MRSRTLLLVLAAGLVVVFALLNWAEFSRLTPLNLGWTTLSAPLGLILLGLLALAAIAFLASSAVNHSRHVRQEREQSKALQAQRELRGLLEQMHRAMTMQLGEMEARLDARIDAAADLRAPASGGVPFETHRAQTVPPLPADQPGETVAARNT